ncbi:MAG TPA: GSU2403 family nucleotidyltransferase fold protein [Gemmatimonadaceae bacterium]
MTAPDQDLIAFARLADALRPWHGQLVIVGGWAHRLHRLLPNATIPSHQPIRTLDADVAFGARARLTGNIGDALKSAGFHEELSAKHEPPVSSYALGDHRAFYAEFLTPLLGSGAKRDGSADATEARAGVTAQKLRYLDVLLTTPIQVALAPNGLIPVERTAEILIAHPVCFVAQKLLIADRRQPEKRAQDVLYVHDTIELFGASLRQLNAHWQSSVRSTLHDNAVDQILKAIDTQYGRITDAMRRAASIPQDRSLTPERLQMLCTLGLKRIFGEP